MPHEGMKYFVTQVKKSQSVFCLLTAAVAVVLSLACPRAHLRTRLVTYTAVGIAHYTRRSRIFADREISRGERDVEWRAVPGGQRRGGGLL